MSSQSTCTLVSSGRVLLPTLLATLQAARPDGDATDRLMLVPLPYQWPRCPAPAATRRLRWEAFLCAAWFILPAACQAGSLFAAAEAAQRDLVRLAITVANGRGHFGAPFAVTYDVAALRERADQTVAWHADHWVEPPSFQQLGCPSGTHSVPHRRDVVYLGLVLRACRQRAAQAVDQPAAQAIWERRATWVDLTLKSLGLSPHLGGLAIGRARRPGPSSSDRR